MTRKEKVLLAVGLALVALMLAAAVLSPFSPLCWHRFVPKGPLVISEDTTYFTGPVLSDGTVDYVAVLNAKYGAGVTPENNAAIPILQAVGSGMLPEKAEEICRLLGMDAPPGPTPQTFDFGRFARDYITSTMPASQAASPKLPSVRPPPGVGKEEADQILEVLRRPKADAVEKAFWRLQGEWNTALMKPWTGEQYPVLADWVKANRSALDKLVEASGRSRYFIPIMPPGTPARLSHAAHPAMSHIRELSRALAIRANLRHGSGDYDGAWSDGMALARLGRLVGQGWTLMERLLGILICGMGDRVIDRLATRPDMTPGQAARYLEDVRTLGPLPELGPTVESERVFLLDAVVWMMPASQKAGASPTLPVSVPRGLRISAVDWTQIFRRFNAYYNVVAECFDAPTFAQRQQAEAANQAEVDRYRIGFRWWSVDSPTVIFGDVIMTLAGYGYAKVSRGYDIDRMKLELSPVVVALAAYRADHGEYPAELAGLIPKYLLAVPLDRFNDKPLQYRREGKGYILYSVGPNMKDDGGRNDGKAGADDIIFKVE